ncbi:MAG: FRG domain-containing protein [Deltaproteobacteria bacterium]|nr:FRG domain-containing protein [Deltaproteobacteria bacterium]
MKVYNVDTWDGVKDAFRLIEEERISLAQKDTLARSSSKTLFRGHSNAEWDIQTTLERVRKEPVLITDYYRHMLLTLPQVEAFSNTRWELISYDECCAWAAQRYDLYWPDYPGYEYMIYLRHHGFPSPLLDWSSSPYVAAFFAYSNISEKSESIAIFAYAEGGIKSWNNSIPLITVKGPYVRSHKRHFLQQCQYTVCSKFTSRGLEYGSHEEVFSLDRETPDRLWKIVAPRSSASHALEDLDTMNVNALSLIGSEDALIQTLGAREYFFNP